MSTRLVHQIRIARTPTAVYAYVTQPWRWCEWHPSSLHASADHGLADRPLAVGQSFSERIALRPLAPLPPTLHRQSRYTVEALDPPRTWQVHGVMRDAWLRLRYDLEAMDADATLFTRTLEYAATGLNRLWLPWLRGRTDALSHRALANLRTLLESDGDA